MFTLGTRDILESAGWYDGRRVDTEAYRTAIEADGFDFLPAAEDLLCEFGGLIVVHPHARVPSDADWFAIDPLRVCGIADARESLVLIKENICPIGTLARDYMFMYCGYSGRVYAEVDDIYGVVGHNIFDAIERLCSGGDLLSLDG